mgnify:CR=1 FL=1
MSLNAERAARAGGAGWERRKAYWAFKWKEYGIGYLFMLPWIVGFCAFVAFPVGWSIFNSFNKISITAEGFQYTWVGFQNYYRMLFENTAYPIILITYFSQMLLVIPLILIFAFFVALLLNQKFPGRGFMRTVFFLPNVIGGLLLGFIWSFIFVKGFEALGHLTGLAFFQLPWLGTASTAFWGIVIVSVWQFSGYLMVIYIAALMNVPQALLEAARIDGASRMQLLRNVIVPLVMPAVTICLFLAISWSFKVFDLNLSLTKGGPFGSTESVALNIYKEAFQNNRYGVGTAKALIFFIVVALISTLQVYATRRKEVEA